MADIAKDDEKKGGGNRNAIAYGLLQRAGVNTYGLSPGEAWQLVSQLNLMESKRWKRTKEDKADIKQKNESLKSQGLDKYTVSQKAHKYSSYVNFSGTSNTSAVNEAVDALGDVYQKYKIGKLQSFKSAHLSTGTMARANGELLDVGDRILRNPNAAYRICSEEFKQHTQKQISETNRLLAKANDEKQKAKYQEALNKALRTAKFDRHNVIYKGEEVRSVVMHETGHVIAGQIFGFCEGRTGQHTNGANKKIWDCFQESKSNGDIYKISAYADTSADEFFAECFAMKHMGKEKLPEKIDKMMEEVLKPWRK